MISGRGLFAQRTTRIAVDIDSSTTQLLIQLQDRVECGTHLWTLTSRENVVREFLIDALTGSSSETKEVYMHEVRASDSRKHLPCFMMDQICSPDQ